MIALTHFHSASYLDAQFISTWTEPFNPQTPSSRYLVAAKSCAYKSTVLLYLTYRSYNRQPSGYSINSRSFTQTTAPALHSSWKHFSLSLLPTQILVQLFILTIDLFLPQTTTAYRPPVLLPPAIKLAQLLLISPLKVRSVITTSLRYLYTLLVSENVCRSALHTIPLSNGRQYNGAARGYQY